MSTTSTPTPSKGRRIGKIIGIVCGSLFLLLVIAYFALTSSAFFKGVILPKVGASMDADITVADASLSPFSKVILTKLEVKPHGKETLLKADEVRLRYSLRDIIGGKITVDEVLIASPVITVFEAADGSSNLDPLTKSDEKDKEKSSKDKSDKPLNLNIKNVSLKNALVQQTKTLKDGGREFAELSNVNFSIDQLKNGEAGKMNLSADIKTESNPAAGSTNSTPKSLQAKLVGAFDYKLTKDALPESTKGNLRVDVSNATGTMAELSKLAAIVNCDVTPTDLREVSLHFEQAGQKLGELRASGPFSFANMEGKVNVELSSLDRRVLNLLGASSGFDHNDTTISSTNQITVAQKGNSFSINGQLLANQFSLTKKDTKETTPVLNLQAAYNLTADQSAKSATIQTFTLNGTQNGQKFLQASLSKPMLISWGGANSTPEDAALTVAITDLNLGDWKSFAGEVAPSGKLNTTLSLVSQQAGKQLSINLTSQLDNFSAKFGSNQIANAQLDLRAKASVAEMKKVSLQSYSMELSRPGQSAVTLNGSGTVNLENKDADLKTSLQGSIAPLLNIIVMPGVALKSGSLKFDGEVTKSGDMQSVKGNFAATDLVGTNGAPPISAQIALDAAAKNDVYDLNKFQIQLSPTDRAKNQLNITGKVDLSKTNAMKGKILVQADALDVTPFYDLYAKPAQAATSTPSSTQPMPPISNADANQEPEPMKLPIEQLLAEINIGKFYLREVEIKDWRATAKIEGSQVVLDPFQLSLNAAPVKVKADLNFGVKGYVYDLSASLDHVPLAPLANTFMPESYGAYDGIIIANANIKGAGTTGVNLKKSLNGNADFTFTNANIKIVGKYLKPILSGIAFVLHAPELTTSPVKWAVADLSFGKGEIGVTNLQLQSDVFTANLKAQIPIADVLTNSPLGKVPVNFGLNYALSHKLFLTTTDTPTNSTYVMLPDFLSLTGTLGEPKPGYDMKKLAGGVLERVGDKIPGLNEKAGEIVKGIGGLFGGKSATTTTNSTNVNATNPPATNQLINSVLDIFKKKKKK